MATAGAPTPERARVRVAICVSHPIPYFCALYAELAEDPRLDLSVLFSVRAGAVPYDDVEFGTAVDSGLAPLLARFEHRFLTQEVAPEREGRLRSGDLLAALRRVDPDVCVIYGFNRRISRLTMAWARLRSRPLAYVSDSEDRGRRDAPRGAACFKRLAAAVVLRGADRLLAVGDANEAFYRRRWVPAERVVRVPFPIDRAAFADLDGRAEAIAARLRESHGLGGVRVVLSSGKLVPRKRQADLIAALARTDHRDAAVLVLLGDGEDRAALEAQADRLGVRLLVTGFVAPDALPPWYRLADVYAHVSDFDPHPLAVSEAVFSGLPIVIGDRTGSWGPTDDVVPGENGLVVPTGDVDAIAAALDRLLGDDVLRGAMAASSADRGAALQDAAYAAFADRLVELAATVTRR